MPDKIITIRIREGKKLTEVTLREQPFIDFMAEGIYGAAQLADKSISDDVAISATRDALNNVIKKGV